MFYLIVGNDIKKSEAKLKNLVESILNKNKQAEVFNLDDENFSQKYFEELLVSQGLFSNLYVVKSRGLWGSKEGSEWLLEYISEIKKSANVFIFIEEILDKKIFKKLESKAEQVWEFDGKDKIKIDDKFIFSIGEAFGARDRKKLWLAVAKAKLKDIPAEIVFWQIINSLRNITAVLLQADLKILKLHPFVISKAKTQAQNFTPEEAQNLLTKLFNLYHDSRRGGLDLYDRLERFSLEV